MSEREDDKIIKWLDAAAFGQNEVGHVELADAGEKCTAADMASIKRATFAKLGLELPIPGVPVSSTIADGTMGVRRSPFLGKRSLFVACIASLLVLAAAVSISSPQVRAQVRKAIQFLPGFGVVQETGEDQVRYVLPSTVTIPVDSGKLEIRGVQVSDKLVQISVTGNGGISKVDSIELVNDKGDRYVLRGGWSGSSREWISLFYVRAAIKVTDTMQLVFKELGVQVPLHLVPAETNDRIEDLGSTSMANGINVTAVATPQDGDRIKVALIAQLPDAAQLETFGFQQHDYMRMPELSTDSGERVSVARDESFPRPNEFYYVPSPGGSSSYRLTIPSIKGITKLAEPVEVTVPIPEVGVMDYRKTLTIAGFQVEITKLERIVQDEQGRHLNSLRIYFDPHFDLNAGRVLLDFNFDYTKMKGGYMTKVDDETRAIQFHEIPLHSENKTNIKLTVSEARILYQGPWQLEWK